MATSLPARRLAVSISLPEACLGPTPRASIARVANAGPHQRGGPSAHRGRAAGPPGGACCACTTRATGSARSRSIRGGADLDVWLAERPRWPGAASSPALFLNAAGARLSARGASGLLAAIQHAAGMDDETTAHVLRHSFATTLVPRTDSAVWRHPVQARPGQARSGPGRTRRRCGRSSTGRPNCAPRCAALAGRRQRTLGRPPRYPQAIAEQFLEECDLKRVPGLHGPAPAGPWGSTTVPPRGGWSLQPAGGGRRRRPTGAHARSVAPRR